jgi:uncharacterized protein (DUF433 family)
MAGGDWITREPPLLLSEIWISRWLVRKRVVGGGPVVKRRRIRMKKVVVDLGILIFSSAVLCESR